MIQHVHVRHGLTWKRYHEHSNCEKLRQVRTMLFPFILNEHADKKKVAVKTKKEKFPQAIHKR